MAQLNTFCRGVVTATKGFVPKHAVQLGTTHVKRTCGVFVTLPQRCYIRWLNDHGPLEPAATRICIDFCKTLVG